MSCFGSIGLQRFYMGNWKIVVSNTEELENVIHNAGAVDPSSLLETLGNGVPLDGNELVSNPGFEDAGGGGADVFADWSESAGDGSITDDTSIYYSGAHSCKLTAGASANTYVSQTFSVSADLMYLISFYVRGSGAVAPRYAVYDVSNSQYIISVGSAENTTASFVQRLIAFLAPASCSSIRVELYCPTINTASGWFDDVSVQRCSAGPAQIVGGLIPYNVQGGLQGRWTWRVYPGGDGRIGMWNITKLGNADVTFYFASQGSGSPDWPTSPTVDFSLDNSNWHTPTKLGFLTGGNTYVYALYKIEFPASQANNSTALRARQNGSGTVWVDLSLMQIVPQSSDLPYPWVEGSRPGCEYDGDAYFSSSLRPVHVASRRGEGLVKDLKDDYNFWVSDILGGGYPEQTVDEAPYADLPGGEIVHTLDRMGVFTIVGAVQGDSEEDLDARVREVVRLFAADTYPPSSYGPQPARLIYAPSNGIWKKVDCVYSSGLQGLKTYKDSFWWQRVSIELKVPTAYWTSLTTRTKAVDISYDSKTFRYACARFKATGLWDDLGLTSNPTSGGTVNAIAVSPKDGKVYFGGNFQGWGGVSGRNYIAGYDPGTDSWFTVGPDSEFNGVINDMAFTPAGHLIVVGAFTDASGDKDYIARWNGEQWSAEGTPDTGTASITAVYAVEIANDGSVIVGGAFTDFGGASFADNIAYRQSGSWLACGSGTNGAVYALACDGATDRVWVGGAFTTAGGVSRAHIAVYDFGGTWSTVGYSASDLNDDVLAIAINEHSQVFIGGEFTNVASDPDIDYIASWTGSSWDSLGLVSGEVDDYVRAIVCAPDGSVLIGGDFQNYSSGMHRVKRYVQGSWIDLDAYFESGSGNCTALAVGPADSLVAANYDIWVGLSMSTSFKACRAAAFLDSQGEAIGGSAPTYPVIDVAWFDPTFTHVAVEPRTLRLLATGAQLWLGNAVLRYGESLYLTLGTKDYRSSFKGPFSGVIGGCSDVLGFRLTPGEHTVTGFSNHVATSEIIAFFGWWDNYKGFN
jgi:hypothetical protein